VVLLLGQATAKRFVAVYHNDPSKHNNSSTIYAIIQAF
jgi:hypothetical protein